MPQGRPWEYDEEVTDDPSPRDPVSASVQRQVERARAAAERRRAMAESEAAAMDYTGLSPVIPGLSQEERDVAGAEGFRRGVSESAPVAASFAAPMVGARLLPFLMRLGARGLGGKVASGAIAGGAAAVPQAIPEAVRGDIGGALEDVATGAALGGVTGGMIPRAAAGAVDPAQLANRLRQIAQTSGANKAAVMAAIKETYPNNWQEIAKFVFSQRTRL